MTIKNEKDFPLCKDCDFSDIDFELRKDEMKCALCQCDYYLKELLVPIVKFANVILEKLNNLLRRKP